MIASWVAFALQNALTVVVANYDTVWAPNMSFTKTNSVYVVVGSVKLVTGVVVIDIGVPTFASSERAM